MIRSIYDANESNKNENVEKNMYNHEWNYSRKSENNFIIDKMRENRLR